MQLILMSVEMGLIYAIVAMGIYLTLRILDCADLTCDSSFALGAIVGATLIKSDCNPSIALIAAALVGGTAGAAAALLNLYCKVTSLLAGILVDFMLYGVNLRAAGGVPNITLLNERTLFTNCPSWLVLSAFTMVVWLVVSYALATDWGLGLRCVGANAALARSCGVNIDRAKLIGLSLSNALIGLGGALFAQYTGFADIGQGAGTLVIGLASVIIGEKLLPDRSLWIALIACAVGSVAYRMIIALALSTDWTGLQTHDLSVVTGLIIIAVMGMPRLKILKRRSLCSR